MPFFINSVLLPLLKSYLVHLATKEVADRVLFAVAEGVVKNTDTLVDDKILAFIRAAVRGEPLPPL